MNTPSYLTVELLQRAKKEVAASPLYKRFISGTPLENDIAVWMADFAGQVLHEAKASSPVADSPTPPPQILQEWWLWCNAHPHALDTVAKRPAAVIDWLWEEVQRLRAAAALERHDQRDIFIAAIRTLREHCRVNAGCDASGSKYRQCQRVFMEQLDAALQIIDLSAPSPSAGAAKDKE